MLHGREPALISAVSHQKPWSIAVSDRDLSLCAEALLRLAKRAGLAVAVAESCTAGRLATLLSDAEGAAQHFAGGFVTYTKDQKHRALGVSATLLREQGAVCGEVARAMAEGALARSGAGLAAAITGVAGPEPDEDGNPVGRVCIAVARSGSATSVVEHHYGDLGRDRVRACAIADTIRLACSLLGATQRAA
jgi:nicotinamide-nucleotide amidase